MRILLTGTSGQVGGELAKLLPAHGDVVAMDRAALDLADADAVAAAMRAAKPDIVVNAGAYTAVDLAERERDLAFAVNARAPQILAEEARRTGAVLVHYSTDYVFDGRATQPYREDDATAPLGVYGRSKLAGERALRDSGCDHLILRTAWVYAARGHNFLRTMLRLAGEREQLRIVADQRGAPTSARLIAAATALALLRQLDSGRTLGGTYHLSAGGVCTWYDFALALLQRAAAAGVIARVPDVVPIATADYPTRATRPAYSVLDTTRFRTTFGLQLPPWQSGLDAVVGELADAPRT